jgi:hypothetical protein
MERTTALRKLRKLIGPNFGYRYNPHAPDAVERAEAREQLIAAEADKEATEKASRDYREALLKGDPQYQELRAAADAARKRAGELRGRSMHYKITVGTTSDLFFSVHAEGDNWPDVIAQVEAKKAPSAR